MFEEPLGEMMDFRGYAAQVLWAAGLDGSEGFVQGPPALVRDTLIQAFESGSAAGAFERVA